MAKRKHVLNKNTTIKRYIEGRGTGKGSEYKPWVTVHDYPSKGRISRVTGIKTKRVHHFLSDLERNFFCVRLKDKMPISFKILNDFVQSTSHLKLYYFNL